MRTGFFFYGLTKGQTWLHNKMKSGGGTRVGDCRMDYVKAVCDSNSFLRGWRPCAPREPPDFRDKGCERPVKIKAFDLGLLNLENGNNISKPRVSSAQADKFAI